MTEHQNGLSSSEEKPLPNTNNTGKTKRAVQDPDMLHGPLLMKILLFAFPIAASSLLQQLLNSADTAVVGRFDSAQALAAVGSNGEVIGFFVTLFTGLSVGANVLVANYIGMRQHEKIQKAVHSIIALALVAGILMAVVGQVIARPLLELMATPDDVMELAVEYLRLYFWAGPFIMLYNFGAAILRAKGDSKRPLIALLISGVFNVILNVIFVVGLHMSVAGVALATDLSNVGSALLVMHYLAKEPDLHLFSAFTDTDEIAMKSPSAMAISRRKPSFLHGTCSKCTHLLHSYSNPSARWKNLSWDTECIGKVLLIGVPAGIQGAVFCLSNLFIQAQINSFGAKAVAGSAAGYNFELFSYYVTAAFAQAATTFIGQNYAAGEYKRCRKIFWICLLAGGILGAVISTPLIIWRRTVILVFTADEEAIAYAIIRMMRVLSMEALCILFEVPAAVLRGMGHSVLPAVETILGTCVLRFIWLLTVVRYFGTYSSIFWVYPVSWILTGGALIVTYAVVMRKQENILKGGRRT